MLYEKFDYVLAIAEEQNMTRAAKRLYVSQPTLTQYLNRLEGDLGVKLFDRTKNPIHPTPAGEYYIFHMKQLRSDEQVLRSNVRAIASPTRQFRLGAGVVRGSFWLPKLLPSFCAIHPDVDVQLMQSTEAQLEDALRNRRLDLVLGTIPSFSRNYQIEELQVERVIVSAHRKYGIIPPGERDRYSANEPCPIDPATLDRLPFIVPLPGNHLNGSYEQLFSQYHIRPSRTITTGNQQVGLQLAVAGLGVYLHTSRSSAPELDHMIIPEMPMVHRCVAAYDADSPNLSLIRDCIRILRTEILSPPGDRPAGSQSSTM